MTVVRVGLPMPDPHKDWPKPKRKKQPKKPLPTTPPDSVLDQLPEGKMGIWIQGSEGIIIVPYAPREVAYTDIGSAWEEVPREGNRTPLLILRQKNLNKMSFSLMIGDSGWETDQSATLTALRTAAESKRPCMVLWSAREKGLWHITQYTETSVLRHPDTNAPTRAVVEVTFTRISDVRTNISPTTGGKKGGKGHGKGGEGKDDDGKTKGPKHRPKKYTVKKGDTLQKIAQKFYFDHRAWRQIARVNKIKNPKKDNKLKPGKVLVLP